MDRERAVNNLQQDYFRPYPKFYDGQFQHMFCITRQCYELVNAEVVTISDFFLLIPELMLSDNQVYV